jgi:beta-galactosidase beta subunit
MGYDTRPLLTLPEKEKFLDTAADENFYLFLEHDAHNPIITVEKTEKGVRLNKTLSLNEFFN